MTISIILTGGFGGFAGDFFSAGLGRDSLLELMVRDRY
jgi:hypothetical protein